MKHSIIMFVFFVSGILSGIYSFLPNIISKVDLGSAILYFLLFFVGISIGSDKKNKALIKKLDIKIFLVPIFTIIGTFLGSIVSSLFISDITIKDSLAVGAGFGYYSISSIIITKISGDTLGVIALLSNVIREITTILLSPFFVKVFGKLAPISSAGATAMDTTLSIIIRVCGKEYSVISIFSGVFLSLSVPFLITIILEYLP